MRLVDIEQVYCSDCEEKGVCEKVTCDVKKMPTIEAVPVVRCKDCKHRNGSYCPMSDYHDYFWTGTRPDDFCSYGVKKEADHEVSE